MDVPDGESSELPIDPVIEWYMRGVDRSLIRENLRKTHEERLLALQGMQVFVDEVRAAGDAMRRAIHAQSSRVFASSEDGRPDHAACSDRIPL